MTRLLALAAITTTVSLGLLFAACSGSSGVTFPDASTTTSTDSGGTGGDGGSTTTDSGIQCAPCATQKPDPACTTTDECGCGPFTCPDGGSTNDCMWSATNNPCGAGKYCDAPTCGAGTCVALGANETTTNNPQCGCDGITYWNPTVAAAHGMSTSKKDACNGGKAVACGGAANTACPTGASCNLERNGLTDCMKADPGVCWVLPATCPSGAVIGKDSKACGATACIGECAAIKTGAPWYSDTCGPILPGGH